MYDEEYFVDEEEILNSLENQESHSEQIELLLEDPVIKSAFNEGVELKEYTNRIHSNLKQLEAESLSEYMQERPNLTELYVDLTQCDKVLGAMETTLGNFQLQLASATSQIKEMQLMSKDYLTKLDNRKEVDKLLNNFLNEMTIPLNLIRTIESGKINKQWVQYLLYFDQKVDFVESADRNVMSIKEQKDTIITLTVNACMKINQWLISKMRADEKRTLDSFQRRQIALKKYTFLFKFLRKRDMTKAKEVVDAYVLTASTLYYSIFQRYCNMIETFQYDVATKNDLLGESEHSIKEFFSSRISKNRPTIFTLGKRMEILVNLDGSYSFPDVSKSKDIRYSYEQMFRATNSIFLDLVVTESAFCKDFFNHDMSDQVLGRTISLLTANLQKYLVASHDVIGSLIIQIFLHSYKFQLHQRGTRNLDSYFDNLSTNIKFRVKQVMDLHTESVREAVPMFLGSIDWKSPHYVTRRYSEFLSSVLSLKGQYSEALKGLDIEQSLRDLRAEMITLLENLGGANSEDKKNLFLINNYALVNTLCKEHNISSPETECFEKLLEGETEKYQDAQLVRYFSKLISFVKANSQKDKNNKVTVSQPSCDSKTIEGILRSFTENNYWKDSLTKINESIMQNFPNFLTGRMIWNRVLTNMFNYYSLLTDIITQYYKDLRTSDYFIPIIEMRYKIKELTSADQ
uniref:Vacuolar protein sorting-associated protein 52 homolog n=1 Tax=Arcella intermedia TaxID=1963864 RepID=A0A6B2KZ04_9EUKA|eukprot:TRINITY_DN25171_c0_g1_i1.p1 TRINITY_DN25171_c0_g1~~TRINITY_DN25171_c0_g1_i1.p1  ORF type:complete len:696 (+),score=168.97 TRINITY_DN25171_c0_g1_i1:28-2088(+)